MRVFNKIIRNKKSGKLVWSVFIVIFFIVIYIINSTLVYNKPEDAPIGVKYEKAKVIRVVSEILEPDPDFKYINIGKQELEIEILSGESKGEIVKVNNFVGRVDNRPAKEGTKLIVSTYDKFRTTVIVNYSRETSIYILLLIFMVIVIIFGKLKGFKSLFSLVFTMVCIIFLFIPLVIKGVNPITASIIIVVISTGVTMISLNGLNENRSSMF